MKTFSAIAASLILLSLNSWAIGNAPETIAGRSCNMIIAEGDGVVWSAYGTYRVDFDSSSNSYAVVPISPNIQASTGTYTYTKTGPNTASVVFTDGSVGIAANAKLVFSRTTTAHYSISLLGGLQVGILVLESESYPTGDPAPNTVAGRSMIAAIESGTGAYAPYGGFRIEFGFGENSYTLSPYSPEMLPTGGTYTYSKTGANSASVTLNDFIGLSSTFGLSFTSAGAAEFSGSGSGGTQSGVALFEPKIESSPSSGSGTLVNMSVRAVLADGSRIIPGFVVEGAPVKVLVRAAGPALAGFGVQGALVNPRFSVYSGDTRIGTNTFWESDNRESVIDAVSRVGAFQFANGSADAALVLDLDPGPYTAVVYGWDYAPGEVLLEVYSVPED